MSPLAPRSSSGQVEALTKGVRLPLPAIEPEHLDVILETLQAAFHDVAADHKVTLRSGDEAEINALMDARLNALLIQSDPEDGRYEASLAMLWRQIANAVARGKEMVSFDGTHIEKRPDLNIFLSFRHPSFPLVVECKLIDRHGGKSPRLYCDNGVVRFLRGEYGWATREAVMLGYIRDGSRLATALGPLLTPTGGANRYAVRQALQVARPPPPDIAHSVHERWFRYVGRLSPNDDPGVISIWHLWMPVPRADLI
ncbi:MAG: hypothetical protein EXR07_07510 [Acetobacteraceae bacterium]|nr:hypothetical protein [Acetobacteraceae bacterium]